VATPVGQAAPFSLALEGALGRAGGPPLAHGMLAAGAAPGGARHPAPGGGQVAAFGKVTVPAIYRAALGRVFADRGTP
jgi:hypothetical protein